MDRDADFSAFVRARRGGLVRAAVLLGCSAPEAEDLAQTALVRCYASWRRVAAARDPDAYVYRTLLNCLASSRRRRWWAERPTDGVPDREGGADVAEAAVTTAIVRQALARLSRPHREVLVLRFFADLPERQVAEVLGVPAGTVKSRVSRALVALSADADMAELVREGSP